MWDDFEVNFEEISDSRLTQGEQYYLHTNKCTSGDTFICINYIKNVGY